MKNSFLAIAVLVATLGLAGCESSEEKADRFFQSGLALLEAGDLDRAAIEFRNVFRFDGAHREARQNLAEILLSQGQTSEAYGQYLRIAEQYPDAGDVRLELAAIALDQRQWSEAERHGRAAIEIDPDTPDARAIELALDYRQAALDEDDLRRVELYDAARQFLEDLPDNVIARRIVIAHQLEQGDLREALPDIDYMIDLHPDQIQYSKVKLQVLAQLGEDDLIGDHLQGMYAKFPDNEEVQQDFISYYLSRGELDRVETFLRDLAGEDTGPPEGHITVMRFLETARGSEAALAELDRLIAANTDVPANSALYRSVRAGEIYRSGEQDAAIAEMRAILDAADPEASQTLTIKGSLAGMLLTANNQVGARALVEEILAQDEANVTALKLRARMLIDNDQPREAIVDLRRALDQSPRDTETILLLADAHERDGSVELQGERLATAFDISEAGAEESLRYADYLIQNDRLSAARSVLSDARAATPDNVEILAQSARLALEGDEYGLVRGIIADLRLIENDPDALAIAESLETALLFETDRIDEGIALLEERALVGDGDVNAVLAIVRTQLASGDVDGARIYLSEAMAQFPDNIDLNLIDAGLASIEGDTDRAVTILNAVIADNPTSEGAVRQLYRLLTVIGRTDEATVVLDDAIEQMPDAPIFQLFKAAELERDGDLEGAVSIYEALYALNTSNLVVANNLASLLSATRTDEESINRAAAVARRLRSSDVPQFRDTYGWVAYRLGNYTQAVEYLEAALEGLPDDPLVNYHLGAAYAALDRTDDAIVQLERALELAGDSPKPQYQTARELLAELQAAPATE